MRLPSNLSAPPRSAILRTLLLACLLGLVAGGCGDPKTPDTTDGPDGPLPRNVKPELVVQTGHTINVLDVAFSPTGTLIASASADSTAKLWDARTQRELRSFVGHVGPVYTVAFSPDGSSIATGSMDNSVRIWEVATGKEVAKLDGHGTWVQKVLFTPDGKALVSGDLAGNVKLWDLASRAERLSLKAGGATALAIAPDGRRLAGAGASKEGEGPSVVLWELPTGKELQRIAVASSPASTAFDEKGERLLVGGNASDLQLFAVESGEKLAETKAHEDYVRTVAFRPGDGAIASAGDESVLLWDATLSKQLASFTGAAYRFSFSRDGKLMVSTGGNEMSGEMAKYVGGSRTIALWDVATRARVGSLEPLIPVAGSGHISNVVPPFQVAFSPSKPIVATAGLDGVVRLWDLRRGGPPRVLTGHDRPIISLAFNARGNKLASGDFGSVHVWLVRTGRLVQRIETPGRSVGFDATGNMLLTGNMSGVVSQWNANTGAKMFEQAVHRGAVVGMQFLADNSAFISAGEADSTIGFWEGSEQLRSTGTVRAHAASLHAMAVSANKVVAAAGGYSELMVTTRPTMQQDASITLAFFGGAARLEQLRGHAATVETLAFSPDGSTLASGGADNTARLWDVNGAREIGQLAGHTASVCGISWSGDGKMVATVDHGGAVRLWNAASRELVAVLAAFDTESYVMATPDNYYTASRDGLRAVAFRVGMRALPFEQYDLRLNRPDLVLKRIGYAPEEVIDTYYQAYRKRLRKMGLQEQTADSDYALPTVRLVSDPPPLSTTSRGLKLRVAAESESHPLRSLLVYANDVPIFGAAGIDLRDEDSRKVERDVELTLAQGQNKIQISVLDDEGLESLRETYLVSYQGPTTKPSLFVLAIGVSRYQDEKLNLDFAAKDAKDVAEAFQRQGSRFAKVHVVRVLDREVTRENVTGAKKFLLQSKVDDQVVVFLAGHGMLDKTKEYYFVPSDFVRTAPASRGLTFDMIEGLLDGIPARRKLLLIDSCHSGEVDEDTALGVGSASAGLPAPAAGALGGAAAAAASLGLRPGQARAARSFRGIELWTEAAPQKPASSYGALQELFADLRRGSGAMVISSAGGAEFALEDDRFQNGVFTYALLEALTTGSADRNQDGQLRISELREYVVARVQDLTGGEQHPTSRRENLFDDFPVY